jgi:virulence-associated protein VagC
VAVPWIRRIYRRGDSMAVTIPRDVRRVQPWPRCQHVEIFWQPPNLVIRPLALDELLTRPRFEDEEDLPDAGETP